jgi:phytoene desaturase
MKKEKIGIIGAGVGGLSTALRLAHAGHDVHVYEKLSKCGGRAHIIEDQGFLFDTGPSFVLMPGFYQEVFDACDEDIHQQLDLRRLEAHYQIFYADGLSLSIFADNDRTKAEFERVEPGSAAAYDRFIQESAKVYQAVEPLLYRSFTYRDLLDPRLWPLLWTLKPFQTYWKLAKKYFKDERLCYVMTFEAMFIGVSPFQTPSFYSVITYADHIQKIFHPMGGMYRIPQVLEQLCVRRGVTFSYNHEVQQVTRQSGGFEVIHPDRADQVDQVVINADYVYSQTQLLKRSVPKYQYSCSVFLLYLGLKQKVKGLDHHNIYFSSDVRTNLDQIFYDHTAPQDPSFYIHVPTVTDASLAPPGKEILYILIPVPNLEMDGQYFSQDVQDNLRRFVLKRIQDTTGVDVEPLIEVEHHFYPRDFIQRYNVAQAATFGLAHSLRQSAFFRPANRDAAYRGLYYVGASTQPGGGLPPVLASSRIVADMING